MSLTLYSLLAEQAFENQKIAYVIGKNSIRGNFSAIPALLKTYAENHKKTVTTLYQYNKEKAAPFHALYQKHLPKTEKAYKAYWKNSFMGKVAAATLLMYGITPSFSTASMHDETIYANRSHHTALNDRLPSSLKPEILSQMQSHATNGIDATDVRLTSSEMLNFLVPKPSSSDILIAGFSYSDVLTYAEIARASYTDHKHQETMLESMKHQGYTAHAFYKNTVYSGIDASNEDIINRGRHAGYIFTKDNDVIISFRGTESNTVSNAFFDLSTDFNGTMQKNPHGKGRIHKGFERELSRSHEYILEILRNYCKENNIQKEDLNFTVTGHSLGAGMATLYVDHLINNIDINPENIHLITFASPRVGNKEFANNLNTVMQDRILRVNVANDIVTGICPVSAGYTHVGDALDLTTPNNWVAAVKFEEHFMDTYIKSLKTLSRHNFKAREILLNQSQAAVPYIDLVLGTGLQALNFFDLSAWDSWTHHTDYKTNLPENKLAKKDALKLLKPKVQALAMVTEELNESIMRGEDNDTLMLFKIEQVKGILAIKDVMDHLKIDKNVIHSSTKEEKKLIEIIYSTYIKLEKKIKKVTLAVEIVDKSVNINEENLKEINNLKAIKQNLNSQSSSKSIDKMIKRAETTYAKNKKLLEDNRRHLEKEIKKLDFLKESLLKGLFKAIK